jgi:transcriptional regulator with XRE-family HTH domain
MQYREFRGMTYKRLEGMTTIPVSDWSRYFNHTRGLNEGTIHKAAEGLGISATRMFNFILRRRLETLVMRERKRRLEKEEYLINNVAPTRKAGIKKENKFLTIQTT